MEATTEEVSTAVEMVATAEQPEVATTVSNSSMAGTSGRYYSNGPYSQQPPSPTYSLLETPRGRRLQQSNRIPARRHVPAPSLSPSYPASHEVIASHTTTTAREGEPGLHSPPPPPPPHCLQPLWELRRGTVNPFTPHHRPPQHRQPCLLTTTSVSACFIVEHFYQRQGQVAACLRSYQLRGPAPGTAWGHQRTVARALEAPAASHWRPSSSCPPTSGIRWSLGDSFSGFCLPLRALPLHRAGHFPLRIPTTSS